MTGPDRPRSDLGDLPESTRRTIEELRRVQPPQDLVAAVVRQAGATPQRRSWRQGAVFRLAGVGAAAAAVLLVALAVLPGLRVPGPGTSATSPSPLPVAGTIGVRVAVPDGAIPGSADERSVWIGHPASGRVLRVDAVTGQAIREIQVNGATTEPYDLSPVTDGESVWVAGFEDRSVVRIDIASLQVTARWPIDAVPYRILPAGDVLWVTDFDGGRVLRIDSSDGTVLGTIAIGRPTGVAVSGASVWVVDYVGNLYEIDPSTDTVLDRLDVEGEASDIAVVGDGLLIWGLRGRDLERLDMTNRSISARLPGVTGMALLDGVPWAAVRPAAVVRLDAERLVPLAGVALGDAATDQLVAGGGRLWVYASGAAGAEIIAIDPDP